MKLVFAFFCSASAFPAMLATARERWPKPPLPEKIAWEHDRTWYHNMKNLTTETVRADSEWWSKFLAFVIVVLGGLPIVACVLYYVVVK